MSQIPEYIIVAYSAAKNTRQRQLNLMSAAPTNIREAQQWANAFAARCNNDRLLGTTDWVGETQLVDQAYHVRTL